MRKKWLKPSLEELDVGMTRFGSGTTVVDLVLWDGDEFAVFHANS